MLNNINYTKDGVSVNSEFINLSEIIKKCNAAKIKEENLLLLKMEWKGWRGFDEGIKERILLPIEKIETIKKYILGKEIYFGEIAGKHSEVYNTLDENDILIITDKKEISKFLKDFPSGHEYNYSFLHTFSDYASDGGYEDITDDNISEFLNSFITGTN